MTNWKMPSVALAALLGTIALLGHPRSANACGGLFCDRQQPVNQVAEQILFVQVNEATIEAHVLIEYEGPAEAFSWVIPVPGTTEVGLSSDLVFTQLRAMTEPRLSIQNEFIGECSSGFSDVGFVDSPSPDVSGPGSEVDVLIRDQLGAFDYALLSADTSEPVVEWLQSNRYGVDDSMVSMMDSYLNGGMNFLAIRLSKSADVGDIQPLRLRYGGRAPMIPLELTAVAAMPDMGVLVWILGEEDALPANYSIVELAPERVYSQGLTQTLYSEAIDEAGGHAFIVERRESTGRYGGAFAQNTASLELDLRQADGPLEFWQRLSADYASDPQFISVMRSCVPRPARATESEFYSRMQDYQDHLERVTFDAAYCTDLAIERIFYPRRHVQELFDALPRLTRMITYLDPAEMTVDPMFCWAPAPADFDGLWAFDVQTFCSEDADIATAPQIAHFGDVEFDPSGPTVADAAASIFDAECDRDGVMRPVDPSAIVATGADGITSPVPPSAVQPAGYDQPPPLSRDPSEPQNSSSRPRSGGCVTAGGRSLHGMWWTVVLLLSIRIVRRR